FQSRKHASKVRLYYMLHPVDGGCPAKKLRSENGSDGDSVDKNKCCTLCNMSFTSAVVAESHYQGKIHAKRLKLLLGEQPALKATGRCRGAGSIKSLRAETPLLMSPESQPSTTLSVLAAPGEEILLLDILGFLSHQSQRKSHLFLDPLGRSTFSFTVTLQMEHRCLKRSYTCNICNVTLNSIEQYHAHLKGSKHQTK
ncbi:ZMAT4 protein, partial [Emberiza fucata]|nr:ZMAT4 protein [Emberiza fucata]